MLIRRIVILLLLPVVIFLQGFVLGCVNINFESFKNYKNPQVHYYFLSKFEEGSEFSGIYFLIENEKIKSLNNVVGQALVYNKMEISSDDVKSFFGAKIVKRENLKKENIQIVYFYSCFLDDVISSHDISFNLQLIFNNEKTFLCYPINFAGF